METKEAEKPIKKIVRKKKIVVKKKDVVAEVPSLLEAEPEKEDNQEKNVESYQSQLTDLERKTMHIAQDHLGTSFNMEKSIGYIKYTET
jgi:hypothetical protein